MAGVGRARQSRRVAHGHGQASRHRRACAATRCSSASTSSSAHELEDEQERAVPDLDAAIDDHVGDDLLRLIFIACHPVLSTDARVALTLRLLGGLTTDEIARAFLVPEPTIAQRIVRAKKHARRAQRPVRGAARRGIRTSVCRRCSQVIYLVFNEGYSATAGDDWVRPALCEDALRLGRILAELVPNEAEVHGLVALMEIQASRLRARVGSDGRAGAAARSGSVAVGSPARSGAGSPRSPAPNRSAASAGRMLLQAAIAACHARARTAEDTDWTRIARLYAELAQLVPVAGRRAEPRRRRVDGVRSGGGARDRRRARRRAGAQVVSSAAGVRGDLLGQARTHREARAEFERAASLTKNAREQALLMARAEASARADA